MVINKEFIHLMDVLSQVREKCGSTTEKTINIINKKLKSEKYDKKDVDKWIKELENSFTIRYKQEQMTKVIYGNLALCYIKQ